MNTSTYLVHHGILGMHWGIRRFQDKNGVRTAAGKARYKTNAKNTAKGKTQNTKSSSKSSSGDSKPQYKPVSEMSDQEIKDFLARIDLEKKYIEAIKPPAQPKSLVQKTMEDFGSKLLSKAVDKGSEALAKKIVDGIFGNGGGNNGGNNKKSNDDDDNWGIDWAKRKTAEQKEKEREARLKNDKAEIENENARRKQAQDAYDWEQKRKKDQDTAEQERKREQDKSNAEREAQRTTTKNDRESRRKAARSERARAVANYDNPKSDAPRYGNRTWQLDNRSDWYTVDMNDWAYQTRNNRGSSSQQYTYVDPITIARTRRKR